MATQGLQLRVAPAHAVSWVLSLAMTILGLLLGPNAVVAADPDELLIRPGLGIGRVALNANIVSVVQQLGTPRSTGVVGTPGTTRFRWYDVALTGTSCEASLPCQESRGGGGLFADATRDGTIVRVGVFYAAEYFFSKGGRELRTRGRVFDNGSTALDVCRIMGVPQDNQVSAADGTLAGWVYPGMVFWMDALHQVIQIDVVGGQEFENPKPQCTFSAGFPPRFLRVDGRDRVGP